MRRVIAADWVLPVNSAPIARGAVVVDAATLSWVGPLSELPPRCQSLPIDTRPGVMTPGLVNAHSHLQYTLLSAVGQQAYSGFEEWSAAFGKAYAAVKEPERWRHAAVEGARQAVASGTTVVAEIVTDDHARGALSASGITGIEYLEVIGELEQHWRDQGRAAFLRRLEAASDVPVGISPHAPYSLDGAVIRDLVTLAGKYRVRIHSHVGESSKESSLYRNGERSIYNDLRDEFELVRLGGVGLGTAEYAESVGLLGATTHLAHAVYLALSERDLLLRHSTCVALCPRSNAVIGVGPAPVASYLREGHEIAVGTDSLASCPSLDLMADVALLAKIARAQGYDGADLHRRLLRAATLGGASALGMSSAGYGTLRADGPADLAVFDVDVDETGPELAAIERGTGCCSLTIAGGRVVHESPVASRASGSDSVGLLLSSGLPSATWQALD